MKLKKIVPLSLIAVLILTVSACSNPDGSSKAIVTSFYPVEFVTKQIVGNDFEVINLTPLGAEPHELELTPKDTRKLMDAKLAIVLGNGFQPAIEKSAESRKGINLNIFKELEYEDELAMSSSGVSYRPSHGGEDHGDESHSDEDHGDESDSEDEHSDDDGHGHDLGGEDPHIWLDPVLMQEVTEIIYDHVAEINPQNKNEYRKNTDALISKFKKLDGEFEAGLSQCEHDTFITSHDAFSRLAERYSLKQESIAGLSPESEPTSARMRELKDLIVKTEVSTVFTEELVSDKVAKSLAAEAGAQVKVLSPIEGLTKAQQEAGSDYFKLMRSNLTNLQVALECSS